MRALFPLTLRPAQSADRDRLIEIGREAARHQLSDQPAFAQMLAGLPSLAAQWVGSEQDMASMILVAQSGEAILGWTRLEPSSAVISHLWVDLEHQGQGVEAMLLSSVEAMAQARGNARVWVNCPSAEEAALRFYRTQGYALMELSALAEDTRFPGTSLRQAKLAKQFQRPDAKAAMTMAQVRLGIDKLDPMLMSLLAERFAFIDRAADLKPALAMPARVQERVEEVVTNARAAAQSIGFDPALTEALWRTMIDLAIAREEVTMGPDEHTNEGESAA